MDHPLLKFTEMLERLLPWSEKSMSGNLKLKMRIKKTILHQNIQGELSMCLICWLFFLGSLICLNLKVNALIPSSPQDQTRRAVRSINDAIRKADGSNCRLYVDYLIPLPPETSEADIDPWPGGLAQQYTYASDILKEILQSVVDDPAGPCQTQVLSEPDCCGFFLQESKTAASQDVAALLFPGADQLKQIADVDKMVGSKRTLLIFNRQFKRPADFGFGKRKESEKLIFDRFSWGFAFQELACRGEDVKLTFEHPNWNSCVMMEDGETELPLFDPQSTRPIYDELGTKINEVLPEPLWMRMLGEAEEKGLKFQRGSDDQSKSDEE